MRPIFLKSAIAVALCSPLAVQPSHAADWSGSYSAQGQCFCVGELPEALSDRVVPTPIGGQTIAQVCKRLGEGPELIKSSGIFNYPVYSDPQCGHGPFVASNDSIDASCAGSLDGDAKSCQGPGPKWSLSFGGGNTATPAAAKPVVSKKEPGQGLIDKPVVSSVSVENKAGQNKSHGDKKILKATIIQSPSTAGRSFDPSKVSAKKATVESESAALRAAFKGKTITIDDQRYLQANPDVSPTGGEPGSKIILDGVVYLRDDAQLNVANLYEVKEEKAKNKITATKVEKQPADSQRVDEKISPKLSEVAVKRTPQEREVHSYDPAMLSDSELLSDAKPVESAKQALQKPIIKVDRSDPEIQKKKDAQLISQADDAAKLKLLEAEEAAQKLAADKQKLKQKEETLLAAEKARAASVNESTAQVKPAGSVNSQSVAEGETTESGSSLLTALRMPLDTRQSSRNFNYLEALPVSYDVGGGGFLLEGAGSSHARFHYVGSLGLASEYQEVMVGGGYYLTPVDADRLTVVLLAGLEYGSFELSDEQLAIDFEDSGIFLGASTRFVLNDRFELKGGVGYSTFFDGDATIFGGGYYHINRQLDIVSRFEIGDNDLLGIGVRFYY